MAEESGYIAAPGHPAADHRLRADRLAGRPAGLDRREVRGSGPTRAAPSRSATDRLLTNVLLYWLTGTAGSSARLHYEASGEPDRDVAGVPVGVAVFAHDIGRPPLRRAANTHRALVGVRPRRPLRRAGGAGPARRGRPGVLREDPLTLSVRALNRALLERQMLLRREPSARRRRSSDWSPCRRRSRRRRTTGSGRGSRASTRRSSRSWWRRARRSAARSCARPCTSPPRATSLGCARCCSP